MEENEIELIEYKENRSLNETFNSLLSFYKENHPDIAASLNEPATDAEINQLEKMIGHTLPDEFKELYKLANGQKDTNQPFFQNGYEFMSISDISNTYEMMMGLYNNSPEFQEVYSNDGTITDTWWLPTWIPFGYMISGDHYCLDLTPGKNGQHGQIIEFIHDDSERYHLGYSITDYLGELDIGLRNGKYYMHPEDGIITDESDE